MVVSAATNNAHPTATRAQTVTCRRLWVFCSLTPSMERGVLLALGGKAMTRALLILAVVVMGCGSPQPCEPTVIDGGNFLGDLATDWGRAKGLFASSEVTTEQEFCSAFGGMVVTVKDSEFVDESAGMRGEYSMFSGITLGNDGLSLAH